MRRLNATRTEVEHPDATFVPGGPMAPVTPLDEDVDGAPEGSCPVFRTEVGAGPEDGADTLYYWDYLHLDYLLNAQHPRSALGGTATHDEFLFIVVHQTFELWFRQILFELDSVRLTMGEDVVAPRQLGTVLARLQRLIAIQRLLVTQIDVLETMTPLDFFDFRAALVPASGFQSVQFRMIENKFGLRPSDRMKIEGHDYSSTLRADHAELVNRTEREPSLCDNVERWLARLPFVRTPAFDFLEEYRAAATTAHADERAAIAAQSTADPKVVQRQLRAFDATVRKFDVLFDAARWGDAMGESKRRFSRDAFVAALFITLYRDEPMLQLPFQIITALISIDEAFTDWRQRHALMAHRMLGRQVGTAGTGYAYLEETAKRHKVFNDLVDVPTFFLPSASRPRLPEQHRRLFEFGDAA